VPRTDRAGPGKELCSSRCPPAVSSPAFTGMQHATESAYFSLLFSVPSSRSTVAALMVSTFHSASVQRCRDAPRLWPCMTPPQESYGDAPRLWPCVTPPQESCRDAPQLWPYMTPTPGELQRRSMALALCDPHPRRAAEMLHSSGPA